MWVRVEYKITQACDDYWEYRLSEKNLTCWVLRNFSVYYRHSPKCIPCHIQKSHFHLSINVSSIVIREICIEVWLLLDEHLLNESSINGQGQSHKTNCNPNGLILSYLDSFQYVIGQEYKHLSRNDQSVENTKGKIELHDGYNKAMNGNDNVPRK